MAAWSPVYIQQIKHICRVRRSTNQQRFWCVTKTTRLKAEHNSEEPAVRYTDHLVWRLCHRVESRCICCVGARSHARSLDHPRPTWRSHYGTSIFNIINTSISYAIRPQQRFRSVRTRTRATAELGNGEPKERYSRPITWRQGLFIWNYDSCCFGTWSSSLARSLNQQTTVV